MGVGVFARLQHTPGIRQWDPKAENWVPICASIWDRNPILGPALCSDIRENGRWCLLVQESACLSKNQQLTGGCL
jgi:hypothetical protein